MKVYILLCLADSLNNTIIDVIFWLNKSNIILSQNIVNNVNFSVL